MSGRGSRELTDDDAKLFIGNLSYHTREERLTEAFEKYGPIKECRVALEPGTERSRGYAFVTMEDPVDAATCVKYISGQDIDGRLIKVEVATGVRGVGGGTRRTRGGDRYSGGGDRDRDSAREKRDSSRDDGGGRERDSRRERDSKGIASGDRGGGTSGGSGAGGRERSRDRAIIRESSRKRESKPFNRDRSGTR